MPPRHSTLTVQGKPTFLLGVNYWSRSGGPRMWDRFDPSVVEIELRHMRQIGLNTCRSFSFIPSFMPQPPILSTIALQRYGQFLDICHAEGMTTIPSFLVGHMSGENYDFRGQNGRSPYTDPQVIAWQQELVRGVATISKGHPAVIAYLASNEMPYWGGPSDPETVVSWATAMRQALTSCDTDRPFSLGDGVMNLRGGQNGFDVEALRDTVDFVGPHTYYADADPLRQALNAEFCVRSLTHLGLPVLFEEFGCSSCQVSEQNQRLYYREVLHACLTGGATGALGWCFSDFDLIDEPPYRHHAFELGFGITRADGSEKPVCDELREFSRLVDRLDFTRMNPPRPQTAILVPSYFNTSYPFSSEDRQRMRRTLLQAYVLCTAADMEAELIPEGADLDAYRLVLVPSTQKLLAPTWQQLLSHAEAGNTVYWSYFGGDYTFHQGAWCHQFERLTGCQHTLRYACIDLPEEQLALHGDGLDIRLSTTVGAPFPRSFLPVEPREAEVLANDGRGRPALLRNRIGQGSFLFLNHPLEYYLAEQHNALPASGAPGLYQALRDRANVVDSPITCTEPTVQVRVVQADTSSLLWLFNHGWEEVDCELDTPGCVAIHGAEAHLPEGHGRLRLSGKQVVVLRLAGSVATRR